MIFNSDSDTFLLLPGQEVTTGAPLVDASGVQTGNIGVAGGSPLAAQAGPSAGTIARRLLGITATDSFEAGVANPSLITGYYADSCTVEAVLAPLQTADVTTLRSIYMCGQGTDYWFWLTHDPHAGTVTVLLNANGAAVQLIASAPTMSTDGVWHYIAARKTVTSGSGTGRLATWDLWVLPITATWSDTPTFTQSSVANVNPPGGAGPYHTVGTRWFGAPNKPGSFYFAGLRASKIARPTSDLKANFNRFKTGGGSTDTTPPTIANVTPAPGTAISKSQVIGFDVTDDAGLASVIVVADFPAVGALPASREVVHDGTFGPAYSGEANTKVSITGGSRFTILRDGGWPAAPKLTPHAVDTSGNVT